MSRGCRTRWSPEFRAGWAPGSWSRSWTRFWEWIARLHAERGPTGLGSGWRVNSLMPSGVVEHFRGRHRPMTLSDADAELGAYGIANVFAGMFGAPLSVGIPARSLAVVRCGGTTRLSNLLHAVFLAAIFWFGAGAVSHTPLPPLGGVTPRVGLCLLHLVAGHRLSKISRPEPAAIFAHSP